jgi:hypothetical protein
VHVSEGIAEDSASVADGRHSFEDMSVKIAIVVLGEIDEVCRAIVVDGDVDSGQLVEPDVVVAHSADYRHQVS